MDSREPRSDPPAEAGGLTEIDELRLRFDEEESLVLSPIDRLPQKCEESSSSKLIHRHAISNSQDQIVLYFAGEEGGDLIVFNPEGRFVLNINKKWEVRSGHFKMGSIKQNLLGYTVFDGDRTLVHFRHPLTLGHLHKVLRWKTFSIRMPEDGSVIGKVGPGISKSKPKDFGVTFPRNMQPQTKALIFGSSFLIFHQFFK